MSERLLRSRSTLCLAALAGALWCGRATAACTFDIIKQGHVAAIIDARTFRLVDGQEVRLAGVELLQPAQAPTSPADAEAAALAKLVLDREVTVRGPTSKPDRYGRLVGIAYAGGGRDSIQNALLDDGQAAFSGDIAEADNRDCVADMLAHEAAGRRARRGIWAEPAAIKNAERPGDIVPWIGRFVVAEGKISSVREAGGIVYVNFGPRWTRDFAVTISRRMIRRFEAWGIALKTLENRTVRVRGFVEQRGGPRMEALGPGQVELVGDSR